MVTRRVVIKNQWPILNSNRFTPQTNIQNVVVLFDMIHSDKPVLFFIWQQMLPTKFLSETCDTTIFWMI